MKCVKSTEMSYYQEILNHNFSYYYFLLLYVYNAKLNFYH